MYASPARFLLTQMVSVAELEACLIGERIKPRWRPAKAREVKLGNPACVSQDHWLWCDTHENFPRAFKGSQLSHLGAKPLIIHMGSTALDRTSLSS
jgi:hypothetical protein